MALTENDRREIKELIESSTEEAINRTFALLGVDTDSFDHVQEFRDGLAWVKKYRGMSEKVGSHVILTMLTILSGGIATAIWAYVTKE